MTVFCAQIKMGFDNLIHTMQVFVTCLQWIYTQLWIIQAITSCSTWASWLSDFPILHPKWKVVLSYWDFSAFPLTLFGKSSSAYNASFFCLWAVCSSGARCSFKNFWSFVASWHFPPPIQSQKLVNFVVPWLQNS